MELPEDFRRVLAGTVFLAISLSLLFGLATWLMGTPWDTRVERLTFLGDIDMARAIYFDEYGRKTGESEETLEEVTQQRPKHVFTPQVSGAQVFFAEEGTRRRPVSLSNLQKMETEW